MLREILLILTCLIVTGCATKPAQKKVVVKEYIYVDKQPLNTEQIEKPILKKDTPWTIYSDGRVCTTKDGFKNLIDDINTIQKHSLKLETDLNSYKKYYDKKK